MVVSIAKKGTICLKCEFCEETRTVQRNTHILTRENHPCRNCSNKINGKNKRGKKNPNLSRYKPVENCRFGSTYINHHGYEEIYVGEEEAKRHGRYSGKYVLLHKYVVQEHLGRLLGPGEIVHHIDGNKNNNDLANLFVCSSMSEHRDIHNNIEQLAFHLFKNGQIVFDKEAREYKIAPFQSNLEGGLGEFRERLRPSKAMVTLSQNAMIA